MQHELNEMSFNNIQAETAEAPRRGESDMSHQQSLKPQVFLAEHFREDQKESLNRNSLSTMGFSNKNKDNPINSGGSTIHRSKGPVSPLSSHAQPTFSKPKAEADKDKKVDYLKALEAQERADVRFKDLPREPA
jgi:hypothetical protein